MIEYVLGALAVFAAQAGAAGQTEADNQVRDRAANCVQETRGASAEASPCEIQRWAREVQRDYPAEAIRNGWEGNVSFRVAVSAEGLATACKIEKSSGYPVLDEAACAAMLSHATFYPATDEDGKAVEGSYATTVRYVLPEPTQPSQQDWRPVPGGDPAPDRPDLWMPALMSEYLRANSLGDIVDPIHVTLGIDDWGRVTSCEMDGDIAAGIADKICAGFVQYGKFLPALDADGKPVSGEFEFQMYTRD